MNFLRSENDLEFRRDQIWTLTGTWAQSENCYHVFIPFYLRVLIDRHEADWCRILSLLLLISNKNTGTIYRARVHSKSKRNKCLVWRWLRWLRASKISSDPFRLYLFKYITSVYLCKYELKKRTWSQKFFKNDRLEPWFEPLGRNGEIWCR